MFFNNNLQKNKYDKSTGNRHLQAVAAESGKSSRRTLAKERRRQQLIESTIKCISRKGLGNTTLADVAREAGLPPKMGYRYFIMCARTCAPESAP